MGGREEINIDVRVIAATNTNLSEAIRSKTFRADLYYRLNVVTIILPSLRERQEDIGLLADHFLHQFLCDNEMPDKVITDEALKMLCSYSWPGNVRELQNVIERAATLAVGSQIGVEDLPQTLRSSLPTPIPVPSASAAAMEKAPLFAAKNSLVEDFEKEYLVRLLDQSGFNITRAAQTAGCHRRTLYRMVHRYEIDLKRLKKERGRNKSYGKAGSSASAQ